MEQPILDRIAILNLEIELAEKKLKSNINNFEYSNYFQPPLTVASNLTHKAVENPIDSLSMVDLLARLLLDNDNILRKILKYVKIAIRGGKMLK